MRTRWPWFDYHTFLQHYTVLFPGRVIHLQISVGCRGGRGGIHGQADSTLPSSQFHYHHSDLSCWLYRMLSVRSRLTCASLRSILKKAQHRQPLLINSQHNLTQNIIQQFNNKKIIIPKKFQQIIFSKIFFFKTGKNWLKIYQPLKK